MNIVPLEKLVEDWATDAVINKTEPGKEIIRIPQLHAKYCSQITAHSVALKMKRAEFIRLKKKKIDYYTGRMSEQDLKANGWEPFRFILKQDLAIYLEADPDLMTEQKKMINNEEAISFCTMVCKELNARTYQLKEFMTWERFIAGQ
jgi:hypothetical protein